MGACHKALGVNMRSHTHTWWLIIRVETLDFLDQSPCKDTTGATTACWLHCYARFGRITSTACGMR
jgi:hypothetical protein